MGPGSSSKSVWVYSETGITQQKARCNLPQRLRDEVVEGGWWVQEHTVGRFPG